MNYLVCASQIIFPDGVPTCETGWTVVSHMQQLDQAAYTELWHWTLIMFGIAFSVRLVKSLIMSEVKK